MRQDPEFLFDQVTLAAFHSGRYVTDKTGKMSLDVQRKGAITATHLGIHRILFDKYALVLDMFHWLRLSAETLSLKSWPSLSEWMQMEDEAREAQTDDKYGELGTFFNSLETSLTLLVLQVHDVILSRSMSSFWVRDSKTDKLTLADTVAKRPPRVQGLLVWLEVIRQLSVKKDVDEHDFFLLLKSIGALNHIIHIDSEARKLLDSYQLDFFAKLGLIYQIYVALSDSRPWGSYMVQHKMDHEGFSIQTDEIVKILVGPLKDLRQKLDYDTLFPEAAKRIQPLMKNLSYPITGPRTKQTVAALRSAEAIVGSFWNCIDMVLFPIMEPERSEFDNWFQWFYTTGRDLIQRTPEWVEPDSQQDPVDALGSGIQGLRLPSPPKKRLSLTAIMAKIKTRGIPSQPEDEPAAAAADGAPAPDAAPAEPVHRVNDTLLSVFHSLIFVPGTRAPNEIKWTDFLAAMSYMGFSFEKKYGSVWSFTPPEGEATPQPNIQFHEPHPSPRIRLTTARAMGTRLTAHYGWNGRMFGPERG